MENNLGNDRNKGHYEYSLIGYLESVLDLWQQDREVYWTEKGAQENLENSRASFEKVQKFAKALLETSEHPGESASLTKVFDDVDLKDFFDESMLIAYVKEHLEASLAWDGIAKVEEGAFRLLSLLNVLRSIENLTLSRPVTDFLKLVTRSYIWGFDTECVILCRSAMEMAIHDNVTDEMCESLLGSQRGYYTLIDCIAVAKQECLINGDIAKIADKIRLRGNKTLHGDPTATKDILGTIKDTVLIIGAVTKE